MVNEALVDKVVARVMALVNGQPVDLSAKNVLMIFSGAGGGYMVGMEAIRRLTASAHPLTVVMTAAAEHIITVDKVRAAGATHIIGSQEWVKAPALVKQTDLLLIPTVSMNLAARLALGLMDSLVCTLTLGALLAGKTVVAIKDGADPNGRAGQVFAAPDGSAPALRAQLTSHLTALAAYGMQLVSEPDFLLTVERCLIAGVTAAPLSETGLPQSVTGMDSGRHLHQVNQSVGGFITEADLLTMSPGSVLRLLPGSRLTAQAQDTARRLGLNLVTD